MNKRTSHFSVILLVLLLAATLALPVTAQDDARQLACEKLWGDWDAEAERCVNEVSYTIGFQYPVEYAAFDFVIEPVNALINQQRDEILGLRPYLDTPIDPTAGYFLDMTYEDFTHGDNIVSLVYTVFYFTGGAHPNSFFETFTFNLDTGERLGLYDVFPEAGNPLDVIAPVVQAALTEKFGDAADAEWIASGAGPDPVNYQDFALTDDSVIFYFEPYQVAAYVFGPSEVEIPLSDLAAVMAPLG